MSKRTAGEAGHGVDVSEVDMDGLNKIIKEQDRVEIIIDRLAEKKLAPVYEKRRTVVSKIPKFWAMAFGQHAELFAYLQNKEDQDALGYLRDVNVIRDAQESRAFTLELHFNENPYFSDSVLRKEYRYVAPPGANSEQPDADGITPSALNFSWEDHVNPQSTTINWKDDSKNLTQKYPPKEDDDDDDAMDTEANAGSFFNLFEQEGDSHEVGIVIADDLYPNAIDYFLGRGPNGLDAWEDDEDEAEDEGDEE
ncbi:hypothetical protein M407DRAFT_242360 [Tulasnella calospora MUT 4182]|uniref:Uncharacterized protein n=1 Tax=Tulasnella calospora MUT 4182 TaxID=1051891 RepID=A0A0C3QF78_9AGAM|nr:hypothetical protein M407DRAFT_242360 [Tulasnella calospora MUT 4182]